MRSSPGLLHRYRCTISVEFLWKSSLFYPWEGWCSHGTCHLHAIKSPQSIGLFSLGTRIPCIMCTANAGNAHSFQINQLFNTTIFTAEVEARQIYKDLSVYSLASITHLPYLFSQTLRWSILYQFLIYDKVSREEQTMPRLLKNTCYSRSEKMSLKPLQSMNMPSYVTEYTEPVHCWVFSPPNLWNFHKTGLQCLSLMASNTRRTIWVLFWSSLKKRQGQITCFLQLLSGSDASWFLLFSKEHKDANFGWQEFSSKDSVKISFGVISEVDLWEDAGKKHCR